MSKIIESHFDVTGGERSRRRGRPLCKYKSIIKTYCLFSPELWAAFDGLTWGGYCDGVSCFQGADGDAGKPGSAGLPGEPGDDVSVLVFSHSTVLMWMSVLF